MWRTLLLGKLSISILASFVVGGICVTQPSRHAYGMTESARWIGVGIFFLTLGAAQVAVIIFLMNRKN